MAGFRIEMPAELGATTQATTGDERRGGVRRDAWAEGGVGSGRLLDWFACWAGDDQPN